MTTAVKETTAMKESHKAAQEKVAQQLVKNAAIAKAAAARLAVKKAATKAAKIAAQAKADAAIKKAQEAARKEAEKARIAAAAAAKAARIEAERIAAAAKAARIEAERIAKENAARIEAERIAAAKRALEEKHKMVQENIRSEVIKGVFGGESISKCAVPYGVNLQLGKNADLFSIFGNNDILKCNKDGIPEFVPAKQKEINNDGIYLLNQNKNNASGQVMYGDTVSLCNKNYTISGKDSNTKVKYGGNITMTPTDNQNRDVIHATVNPNVYSLPNVMNLKSADYSAEYVKKYQHCGNSGGNNDGLAKM